MTDVAALVDDLEAEQRELQAVVGSLARRRLAATDAGVGLGRARHDRPPGRHRRDGDRHRDRRTVTRSTISRTRPRRARTSPTTACCGAGGSQAPTSLAWWDAHVGDRTAMLLQSLDPTCACRGASGCARRRSSTARLMETWAHGLDVRAALGVPSRRHRPARARRVARDPGAPLRLLGRRAGRRRREPVRVELDAAVRRAVDQRARGRRRTGSPGRPANTAGCSCIGRPVADTNLVVDGDAARAATRGRAGVPVGSDRRCRCSRSRA